MFFFCLLFFFFFFNDTATTEIYTLSLHDALPISQREVRLARKRGSPRRARYRLVRSEEHTSELQSHHDLVCRLLLEKKKQNEELAWLIVYLPLYLAGWQADGPGIVLSVEVPYVFFLMLRRPPISTLFPYTPLFR